MHDGFLHNLSSSYPHLIIHTYAKWLLLDQYPRNIALSPRYLTNLFQQHQILQALRQSMAIAFLELHFACNIQVDCSNFLYE